MEHSVGVGAIVGLTFASSLYVWNNDSFSKEQKTVLIICFIFPPAQWVGILIVLAYNNNKVNNSSEKINERKVEQVKTNLDSSISSLTELREKGILTEAEYYEKTAKIKTEKAQQELKNSKEYKQLKSLFDSGVLTKEEFENKIKLLLNIPEKKTNTKEIKSTINTVNKTYLTEINKADSKKESSSSAYIILLFIIFIGVGLIIYLNISPTSNTISFDYDSEVVADTTKIVEGTTLKNGEITDTTANYTTVEVETVSINNSNIILTEKERALDKIYLGQHLFHQGQGDDFGRANVVRVNSNYYIIGEHKMSDGDWVKIEGVIFNATYDSFTFRGKIWAYSPSNALLENKYKDIETPLYNDDCDWEGEVQAMRPTDRKYWRFRDYGCYSHIRDLDLFFATKKQ